LWLLVAADHASLLPRATRATRHARRPRHPVPLAQRRAARATLRRAPRAPPCARFRRASSPRMNPPTPRPPRPPPHVTEMIKHSKKRASGFPHPSSEATFIGTCLLRRGAPEGMRPRGADAGTWLVLAVLGCVTEVNWRGQGGVAASVLLAQGYASKSTASLQLPPAARSAKREHGNVKPSQDRRPPPLRRKGLVRSGNTGPDRNIQRRVQRALSKMEDFDVSILERYGSSLRGMSVSELAGAEAVGDVKALTTLMQPPDAVGDTSRPVSLLRACSSIHTRWDWCSFFARVCGPDLSCATESVSVNVCGCSA